MNKNMMLGMVIVALILGVFIGYSVEKSRATANMESTKMMMQKQVNDMQVKNDELMKQDKMMQDKNAVASPTPDAMMHK